ncbi:hypothetical protein [Spartinivicinus ruber]|uniref:hypothetical protein n=1 Tax=Spartinivicinus ruber TaxID=2683272 RepID=UPI0013D114C1|nr:hypothetical protein [Spartinivicinus ruber]
MEVYKKRLIKALKYKVARKQSSADSVDVYKCSKQLLASGSEGPYLKAIISRHQLNKKVDYQRIHTN